MKDSRPMPGLRRVIAIVAGVAVTGLGASLLPGASVAAKPKLCPVVPATVQTPIQLRVTGMSCATAHKVADRVVRRAPKGCVRFTDARHMKVVTPCRQLGYRCTGREIVGGLSLDFKCRRGARSVHFQY
jgi:hypothetical protein